jgi:cytochrome P450
MSADRNATGVTPAPTDDAGEFTNHDPGNTPRGSQHQYEEWRHSCPVVHSDAFEGFYILNRYADVQKAAKDWKSFSSAKGVFQPPMPERIRVIEMDPPEHGRDRDLLKEILNVDTYRTFAHHVEEDAKKLIDDFLPAGEVDLVAAICEPLPVLTICAIIGLDDEEASRVRPVAMTLFEAMSDPSLYVGAGISFNALIEEFCATRRENPRGDFMTRLATEPLDGKMLELDEIANLLIGFLVAGHHTTTSAMASLFRHILEDPSLKQQLIDDPQLIRAAVEETLRLDTPLHMFGRTTTCPVQIGDAELPADSFVMLNWSSANRDEDQFPNPAEFHLDRSPNSHMAFGHGIHTCVGAQLARIELESVTAELLARIPDVELVGAAPDYHFSGGNLAVLPALPVRFAARDPQD